MIKQQHATASERTTALGNMKQLALGAIMYSSDFDDVLPELKLRLERLAPRVPLPCVALPEG